MIDQLDIVGKNFKMFEPDFAMVSHPPFVLGAFDQVCGFDTGQEIKIAARFVPAFVRDKTNGILHRFHNNTLKINQIIPDNKSKHIYYLRHGNVLKRCYIVTLYSNQIWQYIVKEPESCVHYIYIIMDS